MKESRSNALRKISYDLQMEFTAKPALTDIKLLSTFRLFKQGHSKKISNHFQLIDPMLDSKEQIFDYQYTIQAGNTPVRKNQTVLFIQSRKLELPEFYLRPESWMDRLGRYLGWEDIDFVNHPDFSRKYFLKGEIEELIRDLFNDDVLHYFTLKDGWHLEGIGFFLILYRENKLLDPEAIMTMKRIGEDLFRFFQ